LHTNRLTPASIILKTIVTHTVTYFLIGVISFLLLDYTARYAAETVNQFMRQTSDPIVMAGPLFQPVRGLIFGIVIYLLRKTIFQRRNGWLILWVTLVAIGIFSTYGAAPGSIEGLIYTTLPFSFHLNGLPETLIQSLVFSVLLIYWVNHPEKTWLTWLMGILFFIVLLLPALGLMAG
jgi:hypothetical protein